MLDVCGISKNQMPKLFESYECIGTLLPSVADELGLPCSVSVAAGAGDNAGAAIGTATFGEGKCNISLGTSGTVFISSNKFSVDKNNALHSFCHADGGYHLMGCILSAASCNKWFCDEILNTNDYSGEQNAITKEMLGRNHVYFLPYLMGERSPINDTNTSGTFIGLRPDTTRAKMLLAILEGVCFAIRDNIEIARTLGIDIKSSNVCGGGAKSPLWLEILANVLNITLNVPKTEEGPSLGAIYLSMAASGEAKSVENVAKCEIAATVSPNSELVALYEEKYRKFSKIYPEMKKLFSEIKE
jgi:xylulokinase